MVVFFDYFFKEGYEGGLCVFVGCGFDVFVIQLFVFEEFEFGLNGFVGDV